MLATAMYAKDVLLFIMKTPPGALAFSRDMFVDVPPIMIDPITIQNKK